MSNAWGTNLGQDITWTGVSPTEMELCETGKHLYPKVFTGCPFHKGRQYNVRVRTKHPIIKKPDGTMTNDWTFQQEAQGPKQAGRKVLDVLFGGRSGAEVMVRGVEVWEASRKGIYGKNLWRGTAE